MKRTEFSLLELFQDPLFTMIAIVLMGTVWLIIPGKSTPVDPKVYAAQDTNQSIKREIELMKEKMKQLMLEIERLKEEVRGLESRIDRAKDEKDEPKHARSLEEVNQKIREIMNEIEKGREKLKLLEDELKRAREALSGVNEKGEIEILRAKINKLEKEIERLRESLRQLEEALKKARQKSEKAKEIQDAQKNLVALLQKELKAKLEEIKKLEAELERIRGERGGEKWFKPPKPPRREKDFAFQLTGGRAYPVDDEHYNVQSGNIRMDGGRTAWVTVKTRKSSSKGESIEEIQKPESKFQKVLRKLDKKEYRIMLILLSDSFEIFRKAREIVQNYGFEMAWFADIGEEIVYSSIAKRTYSTHEGEK